MCTEGWRVKRRQAPEQLNVYNLGGETDNKGGLKSRQHGDRRAKAMFLEEGDISCVRF